MNKPDSKFCAKCDAYEDMRIKEQQRDSELVKLNEKLETVLTMIRKNPKPVVLMSRQPNKKKELPL